MRAYTKIIAKLIHELAMLGKIDRGKRKGWGAVGT